MHNQQRHFSYVSMKVKLRVKNELGKILIYEVWEKKIQRSNRIIIMYANKYAIYEYLMLRVQ